MKKLLLCGFVVVCGLVIQSFAGGDMTPRELGVSEMNTMRGGAFFTATECVTGTGGCATVAGPPRGVCPAGVGAGGICPGTFHCNDATPNMVCSAPYGTNNIFDLNCVATPLSPYTCVQKYYTCDAAGNCSGGGSGQTGACGTATTCYY